MCGRRVTILALAALVAVLVPGAARGDANIVNYYSGTLTDNYHNFGRCYYSIASECSGWNYWRWNESRLNSTNGSINMAFENGSTHRGTLISSAGVTVRMYDYQVEMGGWYKKASVTLWTANRTDFAFARTCAGTDCDAF